MILGKTLNKIQGRFLGKVFGRRLDKIFAKILDTAFGQDFKTYPGHLFLINAKFGRHLELIFDFPSCKFLWDLDLKAIHLVAGERMANFSWSCTLKPPAIHLVACGA